MSLPGASSRRHGGGTAFGVLRAHAQAASVAKRSLLVSSQRGVAMRAAALLRSRAKMLLQTLQQRRAAAVCMMLTRASPGWRRCSGEAILKRRQYESHQAELDKQRHEARKQEVAAQRSARRPSSPLDADHRRGRRALARTAHAPPAALGPGRSALDKLFACSTFGRHAGCAPR